MSHATEQSDLTHFEAYRMSRVFDEMQLTTLPRQLATFNQVNLYRDEVLPGADWDEALRRWIDHENDQRRQNAARYGVEVEWLPTPATRIVADADERD